MIQANFKTDSNKSLKKNNAELQAKLEEGMLYVMAVCYVSGVDSGTVVVWPVL